MLQRTPAEHCISTKDRCYLQKITFCLIQIALELMEVYIQECVHVCICLYTVSTCMYVYAFVYVKGSLWNICFDVAINRHSTMLVCVCYSIHVNLDTYISIIYIYIYIHVYICVCIRCWYSDTIASWKSLYVLYIYFACTQSHTMLILDHVDLHTCTLITHTHTSIHAYIHK
jgi:hypothetical protein